MIMMEGYVRGRERRVVRTYIQAIVGGYVYQVSCIIVSISSTKRVQTNLRQYTGHPPSSWPRIPQPASC